MGKHSEGQDISITLRFNSVSCYQISENQQIYLSELPFRLSFHVLNLLRRRGEKSSRIVLVMLVIPLEYLGSVADGGILGTTTGNIVLEIETIL